MTTVPMLPRKIDLHTQLDYYDLSVQYRRHFYATMEKTRASTNPTALFYVIHGLVIPYFYSQSLFQFVDLKDLSRFVRSCPRKLLRSITRISVISIAKPDHVVESDNVFKSAHNFTEPYLVRQHGLSTRPFYYLRFFSLLEEVELNLTRRDDNQSLCVEVMKTFPTNLPQLKTLRMVIHKRNPNDKTVQKTSLDFSHLIEYTVRNRVAGALRIINGKHEEDWYRWEVDRCKGDKVMMKKVEKAKVAAKVNAQRWTEKEVVDWWMARRW